MHSQVAAKAVLDLDLIVRPEAQDYFQWQRAEQPAADSQRGIGQRPVEAEEEIARWENDHVRVRVDDDDDGRDRGVSGKLERGGSVLKAHCLGQHHLVFVQTGFLAESSQDFHQRRGYHGYAAACGYVDPGQARLQVSMTWTVEQLSLAAKLGEGRGYQSYRSTHVLAKGYSYVETLETNNVLSKYLFQGFLGIVQRMAKVD